MRLATPNGEGGEGGRRGRGGKGGKVDWQGPGVGVGVGVGGGGGSGVGVDGLGSGWGQNLFGGGVTVAEVRDKLGKEEEGHRGKGQGDGRRQRAPPSRGGSFKAIVRLNSPPNRGSLLCAFHIHVFHKRSFCYAGCPCIVQSLTDPKILEQAGHGRQDGGGGEGRVVEEPRNSGYEPLAPVNLARHSYPLLCQSRACRNSCQAP